MANQKTRGVEEELIERRNKYAAEAVEVQVGKQYNDYESKGLSYTTGIQESFREEVEKMNTNLYAIVYFLLSAQLTVSFIALLILDLMKFIVSLLLLLIIIFVLVVYIVAYCLITRQPERFKRIGSGFFIWTNLAVCEAIILCFFSLAVSPIVFLLEVAMIIIALFVAFLGARVKKDNFTEKMGVSCITGMSLVMYVIWMVSFEYYLWVSLCTVFVLVYEIYLVKEIHRIVPGVEQEGIHSQFTAGVFVCLMMFKSKIDLFFHVANWVYSKTCKKKEDGIDSNN